MRSPTDLSQKIKVTTDRLTQARVGVASIERELHSYLAELEAMPVPPRPRGRPRKYPAAEPAAVSKKTRRPNKPYAKPAAQA